MILSSVKNENIVISFLNILFFQKQFKKHG